MIIRTSGYSFGLNGIPLANLDGPHIRRTSLRRNSRMGIVPTRNSNNYFAAALGMTIELKLIPLDHGGDESARYTAVYSRRCALRAVRHGTNRHHRIRML